MSEHLHAAAGEVDDDVAQGGVRELGKYVRLEISQGRNYYWLICYQRKILLNGW
jgi:hypothetical protein